MVTQTPRHDRPLLLGVDVLAENSERFAHVAGCRFGELMTVGIVFDVDLQVWGRGGLGQCDGDG